MAEKYRSFSVYLLKEGYDESNFLSDGNPLKPDFTASSLPEGATIFVLDNAPREPWWKDYFKIAETLSQQTKGAIITLPAGGRVFVLAFGHVQHHLVEGSYVYDFGLRVTLNAVDPKKLKSTDTLEPGASRRKRTQLPNEAELTLFDFDKDSSVLKSLTGRVKDEYAEYFKHPTGSANLRFSTNVPASNLPDLCERLLELYNSEDYLKTFRDIRSVEPVRDKAVIDSLNEMLVNAVKARSGDIILSVPDFVDFTVASKYKISGLRKRGLIYDDIYIDRYYEYLEIAGHDIEKLTIDDLLKHRVEILNEDESTLKAYSIYKGLIFDVTPPGALAVYHVSEGAWYKFEQNLVDRLKAQLDASCVVIGLPDYIVASEGLYNSTCAQNDADIACLDTTDISPPGQTAVEPCDLVQITANEARLIHVKLSTRSSQLSHLFNQGLVSAELIREEKQHSAKKFHELISAAKDTAFADRFAPMLDSNVIRVRFAIVTHKDPARLSDNLPMFSKMTLSRTLKELRRMNFLYDFGYVADKVPSKPGRTQKPKARKTKEPEVDDDDVIEP